MWSSAFIGSWCQKARARNVGTDEQAAGPQRTSLSTPDRRGIVYGQRIERGEEKIQQ
jgi:hypothetical protein